MSAQKPVTPAQPPSTQVRSQTTPELDALSARPPVNER